MNYKESLIVIDNAIQSRRKEIEELGKEIIYLNNGKSQFEKNLNDSINKFDEIFLDRQRVIEESVIKRIKKEIDSEKTLILKECLDLLKETRIKQDRIITEFCDDLKNNIDNEVNEINVFLKSIEANYRLKFNKTRE